jgi:hypothetical protein
MAQLSFHRLKGVVDNLGQRRVRPIVHLFLVSHEFMMRRDRDVDTDPELVPFLMGVIGLLDGYVTPVDVIAEFFKPRRFFQNEFVDRFRLINSTIRNIYWPLHN